MWLKSKYRNKTHFFFAAKNLLKSIRYRTKSFISNLLWKVLKFSVIRKLVSEKLLNKRARVLSFFLPSNHSVSFGVFGSAVFAFVQLECLQVPKNRSDRLYLERLHHSSAPFPPWNIINKTENVLRKNNADQKYDLQIIYLTNICIFSVN